MKNLKGISGLVLGLVLIPILVMSLLAVASTFIGQELVEDISEKQVGALEEVVALQTENATIKSALNSFQKSLAAANRLHLTGLSTGRIGPSQKALEMTRDAVDGAARINAGLSTLLGSGALDTASKEAYAKEIVFLNQSSKSLPLYVTYLVESRTRTIEVFQEAGRGAAASNFAFEEAQRVNVLLRLLDRIEDTTEALTDRMGTAVAERGAAQAEEGYEQLARLNIGLVLAVIAVSLAMLVAAYFLSRRKLSGPIAQTTDAMVKLSNREYDVVLPENRKDEIGAMVETLAVFRAALMDQDKNALKTKTEMEQRESRRKEREEVTNRFNAAVSDVLNNLGEAARSMASSGQDMLSCTEITTQRSSEVTRAATETANNVQTVASAAEELSASLRDVSAQVANSNSYAQAAVDKIGNASKQVSNLNSSAQKIGDVITMISDIAEQTNLLALNATIESARAGEAGKGFAVVANEVKSLANQTATATEDIRKQIAQMQGATEETVGSISEVEETIRELSGISDSVASVVHQQSDATTEIARNIQEASAGTTSVSRNASEVDNAAQQAGLAATKVQDVSEKLSQESSILSDQVRTFLESIDRTERKAASA